VVRAGALAAGVREALPAAGALAGAEELAPEEQAARAAANDVAHRIPAMDRVLTFILGPSTRSALIE
jgi:hypothetical protein